MSLISPNISVGPNDIVVTDPLNDRIVILDKAGHYERALELGFSPARVTVGV